MSSLRKLEREVIRNKCYKRDGNTKAFKSEWEKHHYKEDVKRVEKKKKRGYMTGKQLLMQMKLMKKLFGAVKKASGNGNEPAMVSE